MTRSSEKSRPEGTSDRPSDVPHAEPTRRVIDELEQTQDAPAFPRIMILDAAEGLLQERGLDALTADAIARRADVEPDVVHAHFANNTAIVAALSERFCARAVHRADEAVRRGSWSQATPREVLELAVWSLLDVFYEHGSLLRAMLASNDERIAEAARRAGSSACAKLAEVIRETRGEPKPDARVLAFGLVLAISTASQVLAFGTDWTGHTFEREELYERITAAVVTYVEAATPAAGSLPKIPRA